MKQTSKRSLSFVLALMLVVSLFSGITVTASAETATNGVPVAFIDNGVVASVSYAEVGSTITLPEATNNGDPMYVFQGWVIDAVSNSTSAPETVYAAGAEYTVEDTVVFYALYNYFVPSETEPMATEPEVVEPADGSTLTIPEFNALGLQMDHNTYTTGKFYVTGTVSEIKDAAYGNMYLVDDAGNKLYIYGLYDENDNRYDSMNPKPEVGAVLTVYGAAGQFNDAAQMKNAVVTGWVDKPEPEVTEPPATEPAADSTLTIADAIALGQTKTHDTYTEGKYYVTGVISQVYNTSYGNMYITDDAGNKLTVYGTFNADGTVAYSALEVKPVAGDTITVYGIIGQYNGVSQMKDGWITDHVVPDVPVETEPVVIPEDGSTLTIPEFNKVGSSMDHSTYTEGKYYVTGTVSTIENTTYGNLYLVDADRNKLYVYGLYDGNGNRFDAMNPQPTVGSILTVYGAAGQYNGAPQMKNADISAWENKPETEATEPEATEPEATEPEATNPSDSTTVTVTTNIGEYASANSWADATQYATINMDSNITVTATGKTNTGKYYANGNNWRIYQNETPAVTIAAANGTIQSVKITYTINNSGVLKLNGSNVTSGTVVDVNAASVSFGVGNTGSATNGQVRITAIEVVYLGTAASEPEVTEPEVTEPEVTEPEVTEPEVTEPEVTEPEVTNPSTSSTVTVTTSIADYAAANGWTDSTKYLTIKMDDNITVTATGGGNTGKYYVSGNDWRIYQTESPTVTVAAANGTIQSVKITYVSNKTGVLKLNGSNVTSGTVVDVNAASVSFGVGNSSTATNGQVRITAIEVVYSAAAAASVKSVRAETTENELPVDTTLETKTMYKQVVDASLLTAGCKVIITAASTDYPYALGTYQKNNNRGYGAITRYGNLVYISDDVQVITLEAVADSANLAFNVGNGYLYAASSTSNHLKTQTENDANGQWAITIDAAGVASVVAQGTNTHNILRFNPNTNINNGTPLFACYQSGQYDIMFYVETEVSGKTYYTTDIKGLSCDHANETEGTVAASCVDCGYDYIGCADCGSVLMLIDFAPANGHSYGDWTEVTAPTYLTAGEKAKTCAICNDTVTEEIPVLENPVTKWNLVLKDNIGVNFVLNLAEGQVVTATVAGEAVEVTPVQTAEGYVVSFDLAAAQMTDVIVISVDGMPVTEGYTIRGYAETILAGEYDDDVKALANAMLQYGAAAQLVFDHNATDLANVNAKDAGDNVISGTAAENNAVMSGAVDGVAYYGASLLHKSKMGVRFYFTLAEGADIASYRFSVNGNDLEAQVSGDKYYIQINDIMPQDLAQAITVNIISGNDVATVSYSPMNYIVRQYNNNAAIKDLMQQLYDYYVAAVAVA